MSKTLLIHKNGESLYFSAPHVPRVGEHIGRFHTPFPVIKVVIHYPSKECLDDFKDAGETKTDYWTLGVDAIVVCE